MKIDMMLNGEEVLDIIPRSPNTFLILTKNKEYKFERRIGLIKK